jgi:hypothetical protein
LNPLGQIPNGRILEQCRKNHDEAGAEENVNGFDIADFWEGFVRRGHQSCHGEDLDFFKIEKNLKNFILIISKN